jgi:hypothetical protein
VAFLLHALSVETGADLDHEEMEGLSHRSRFGFRRKTEKGAEEGGDGNGAPSA